MPSILEQTEESIKAKRVKAYAVFLAHVNGCPTPFFSIPTNPNNLDIIGIVPGLDEKDVAPTVLRALKIFFVNGVVYLDTNETWIKIEELNDRPATVRVKVIIDDLFQTMLNREFNKSGMGVNILRHIDYSQNHPLQAMASVQEFDDLPELDNLISMEQVKYIFNVIDYFVKAVSHNRQQFIINIGSGPIVYVNYNLENNKNIFTEIDFNTNNYLYTFILLFTRRYLQYLYDLKVSFCKDDDKAISCYLYQKELFEKFFVFLNKKKIYKLEDLENFRPVYFVKWLLSLSSTNKYTAITRYKINVLQNFLKSINEFYNIEINFKNYNEFVEKIVIG